MRKVVRWARVITVVCSLFFVLPMTALAAGPLKFDGSTQFLWGDDLLGDSQAIVAQYLRLSYTPPGDRVSVTGYGRFSKDFDGGSIRDNDLTGRLYYLYMDYRPFANADSGLFRLGRQYVNLSAGSAIVDGLSFTAHHVGTLPVGLTVVGGRDVRFSLDSESSRAGNLFWGLDLHLEGIKATQLGISYVRRQDDWDRSREEIGMNFRYVYRFLSPYAEVRYDLLSKTTDEATVGIDLFPMNNLMIKGEFYQSYPTFDSTSIYSVFAVDRFREYLVRAEYSLEAPVTLFAAYARQNYQDSSNADNYVFGARVYPLKNLTVSASVDYRTGYGGNLWGFEVTGDYKISNKIMLAGGVQYDAYKRPDNDNNGNAQRYWLGGQYIVNKNVSVNLRLEDNVNENFNHRTLGRIAVNWTI